MRHEAAAAGGDTNTPLIEIEAKIGHLIDKNTNARLRLPVMTETVMDDRDNGWRVNFKSSMTEVCDFWGGVGVGKGCGKN